MFNYCLGYLTRLVFFILLSCACAAQAETLVAHWQMDEAQWSGQNAEVRDSSGFENHGTAINGGSTTDALVCRGGWFRGEGYNADPNNAYYRARYYVRVPDNDSLSPLVSGAKAAMSLSGWFNTAISNGTIIHKGDGGNSQEYQVFIEGRNLKLRVWNKDGSPATLVLNHTLSSGQWYFFHASAERVGNSDNMRLNISLYSGASDNPLATNNLQTRISQDNKNTSSRLYIGAVSYGGEPTDYFDGLLDEVRVYEGLRTTAQIIADKNERRTCAGATQCLADNFDNSLSTDSWVSSTSSGNFTPQVVNGRLRMTQAVGNQSTSVTYQRLYPAADNLVIVEFDYWAYGGNGADGLAVVLSDATVTPQAGSFGGPLGYGFKPGIPGFAGGWLGFGLDEYGNFSAEGGSTNVGRRRQSVVVRGSGSGTSGYRYLRGTCNNGSDNRNGNCLSPPVDGNRSTPHRYRFTIDTRTSGSTLVSVERNTGSGFVSLIAPFDAQSISGQAVPPENFLLSLTGSTGGSNNVHELDNLSICAQRSEPVGVLVDHFELSHPAEMVSCLAAPVQIKACLNKICKDATEIYTDPLTVTLAANGGASWAGSNTVTLTNGVGTAYLRNPVIGANADITIEAVSSVPAAKAFFRVRNRCVDRESDDPTECIIKFVDSGLLFAEVDGELPLAHQTAGVGFSGVLRAIKTNPDDLSCEARIQDPQPVELGFSCENPGTCISGQQFSVNDMPIAANDAGTVNNRTTLMLDFDDTGAAPLTMNYSDVGQLRLHARLALAEQLPDPAITLQTSSNAFVVRPHTLAVVQALRQNGSTNPGTTNTGDGFVAAGEPFNIVIEAQNASGAATPNFGRENPRQRVEAAFNKLEYPKEGSVVPLSAGETDITLQASSGRQRVTKVKWNEAGSLRLQAKLSNDSYLTAPDISIKPASDIIGRFYPDHFNLASRYVRNSDSCINFSYMSQPDLTINYKLEAKGAEGNVLQYYHSPDYEKTAQVTVVAKNMQTGKAKSNLGGRLSVFAGSWQHGVYEVTQSNAAFKRHISMQENGPFAKLQLGLQISPVPADDSRNFVTLDFAAAELGECTTQCTGVKIDEPLDVRFGRLALDNAYGPENEPLPVTVKAEYWNGERFVVNADDNCTVLESGRLMVSGTVPLNNISVSKPLSNGTGSILLSPSSLNEVVGTNTGFYRLVSEPQFDYPWLQYNWSGKLSGCSVNSDDHVNPNPNCYDENPTAEFMFGRFRGNPRQIFWRELFR